MEQSLIDFHLLLQKTPISLNYVFILHYRVPNCIGDFVSKNRQSFYFISNLSSGEQYTICISYL